MKRVPQRLRTALVAVAVSAMALSVVPASQAEPGVAPGAPVDRGGAAVETAVEPTGRAVPKAPKPGRCFDVTLAKASKASLKAKAIRCGKPHTLWVVGKAKVPAGLPMDLGDSVTSVAVKERCVAAVRKKIGGYANADYARSTYGYFVFLPTRKQQRRGARWASCAVGHWDAGRLLRTKQARPTRVASRMPAAYTLCATSSRAWVGCAKPHAFRSTYARTVAFDGVLTDAKVRLAARTHCEPRMGRSDYTYGLRGSVGQTFALVCLRRTTS